MRIAYLTGRYPDVSHTFILREVERLRRLGVGVESFSIWRTKPEKLLSPADRAEQGRTYSLLPPRVGDYLRAHSAAIGTAPLAHLRLLAWALRLGAPGSRGKLLGLSWFLESVVLWHQCAGRGVRHVHAHLNGTAPAVALLTARFGNAAGRVERWTWSMTVHGPTEFYDVVRERLAEKVREALFVVCISDFARSQLMTLVEEEHWDKLEVVHVGVPVEDFPAIQHPSPNGGPLRLLTVGRLAPMKGQAVLIEAVARLVRRGTPVKLTVVGDGPRRPTLERLVRENGLDGLVDLAGAVGQDRIRRYYQDADVFCLSSFAEGVPVVLMEAMSTQLPVVAPRIMGIGELVENGEAGLLVAPGSPDQLASAIARLASDRELRTRMGIEGRGRVETEFELERSTLQLRDLFCRRLEQALKMGG